MEVSRGTSLAGEFYATEGELIRLTLGNFDYQRGGFKHNTSKDNIYFSGKVKEEYILNEGDIITPLTEQTAGLLGSTARIPESGKYIQSQDVALIRCNEALLDPTFCYYLLPSASVKKQLGAAAQQTKIRHTTPDRIKEVIVDIPPLAEQKAIGKILDAITSKIELNYSINHYLEAMAKQIYDYWFVQFDFPDAEGKPYKSSGGKMVWNEKLKRKIPAGWEIKTLNDIVNVKDGTHDSPKQQNTGYYLITSKHLQSTGIDFKTAYCISSEDYLAINKRSRVDTNDILFSMIGTIGNKYLVSEENINFAIKNMALIKSSENISIMYFLWFYLSSPDYIRYEHNAISGSIQKFLSLDAMRKIPVLFDEIVLPMFNQRVSSICKSISNLNNENSILIKQRDELLLFLMNEQVSVNNDLSHD